MTAPAGMTNWIKLLTLGLIWGASFMFITVALRDLGPLTIVAGRVGLGAVVLLIILRRLGLALPDWRSHTVRLVWVSPPPMGLFASALPFALLRWGLKYVRDGFD